MGAEASFGEEKAVASYRTPKKKERRDSMRAPRNDVAGGVLKWKRRADEAILARRSKLRRRESGSKLPHSKKKERLGEEKALHGGRATALQICAP